MFLALSCSRAPLRQSLRPPWVLSAPHGSRRRVHTRRYATSTGTSSENLNVEHAAQISDSSTPEEISSNEAGGSKLADEIKEVGESSGILRGKLLPTASHLFKLVLPLPETPFSDSAESKPPNSKTSSSNYPPTIFLLHPSQPLSHISRLITASFPSSDPRISFQSSFTPSRDKSVDPGLVQGGGRDDPIVTRKPSDNGGLQWSDSTDIGDFVKEAALDTEFLIVVKPGPTGPGDKSQSTKKDSSPTSEDRFPSSALLNSADDRTSGQQQLMIRVKVPSFGDRTRFLRAQLESVAREISSMEELKRECDKEAHRGARRVAFSGFGALVVYWGAVARLTFWDVGWEFMEPVTYLSGLSTVILGYLWFLYQGREVSYSSVLSSSILSRRQALYAARGFDVQRWSDLMDERKTLRREIQNIAMDYEVGWKEGDNIKDEEEEGDDEESSEDKGAEKAGKAGAKGKALMSESDS